MNPSISIVIRTKDEAKHLGKVLKSLNEQQFEAPIEIIVVDSGSTDNTISIAENYNCKIIKLKPEEFSFGRALNIGIETAKGEIIVILSGHSIPCSRQFLKKLIEPYDDPFVMATFGRNAPSDDACPSEAKDLENWFPDEWLYAPERFSNGNSSLRRSLWKKLPFDEEVSGSEDIIWARQVVKLGYQVVYVPIAAVYHSHSSSPRYTFIRRFRETKSIVKDDPYKLRFIDFTKWTLKETLSDLHFAFERHYHPKWYFHIPLYRTTQGFAMYILRREKFMNVIAHRMSFLRERFLGYYYKSHRIIKNEGWMAFLLKAASKASRKIKLIMNETKSNVEEDFTPINKKFPTPRKFKVIFIVDPLGPLTNHYRAYNIKEYLKICDIESDIIPETDINTQWVLNFDFVILCRVFMKPHIQRLVEICKTLNIPVVFDVDDYVIDVSIIDHIASIEHLSEYEKSLHKEGIRKHRESFEAADFFTAPTDYLADVGNKLGKTSFVIRNALSSFQMENEKKINEVKRDYRDNNIIRIGYFSGTSTHQKDFSAAVTSLLRIMDEFTNVHLYIGGYLDLDKRFNKFSERIKRLQFVDINRLPYNIARVDINIVPLELNNPFCEAKSELKYFDAAIIKIPTVASPTDAFKWAIKDGYNGFLAASSDEWYSQLKKLIEDSELRKTIGQRAYEHAIKHYSPDSMSSSVKNVYKKIIYNYRQKIGISENVLKINFIIPPPVVGSGGHNKIFTAAKYLTECGHSIFLYFINDGTFTGQKHLKDFISTNFFDPGCEIVLGTDNINSSDILCATSWITAYVVRENKQRAAKLFYFVQDLENLFFPMSDEYLKAENTYRLGFHHITYGPWCANIIKNKHKAKVDYIPFSLNRNIYNPKLVEREKTKQILFFARPEMPRRCYNLGIEALNIFYKRNPDVKIILFGSKMISSSTLPFPHKNLGVLRPENLAKLYSSVDAGIAFSTTNPSMVPFEMMACKCPVIDLDYNDNYINYGSRENVKLVGISPEEIATGVEELINDDHLRDQIAQNGYSFVSNFPDEKETFRYMENIFLNSFNLKESTL